MRRSPTPCVGEAVSLSGVGCVNSLPGAMDVHPTARCVHPQERLVGRDGARLEPVRASIDGCDIDGLVINGVDVSPLVEAELVRREPARSLRRSPDPAGLRAASAALESVGQPCHQPQPEHSTSHCAVD
jgi:hypothetical protein